MKRIGFLAMFFALFCAAQNTMSNKAYDNFHDRLLSPDRWALSDACGSDNGREMECVREIANGKLHLAHRQFGLRDSDQGTQFGIAQLNFANPWLIKSVSTDVVVQDIEEAGCPANTGYGGAAGIDATFFNTGTGDPNDDVAGHLALGRGVSDPPGQLTVFSQISHGGDFFGYVWLGTVDMGTPVTMTLTWDQPNHQFRVSLINHTTHVKTQASMPYDLGDRTPATNPARTLLVGTLPANCTANATWVYVDATFDNVSVGY
jgi:hypothetical protein